MSSFLKEEGLFFEIKEISTDKNENVRLEKKNLQTNFSHKIKYSPKAKIEEPPDINKSKARQTSTAPPYEIRRVSVSPEHNNDP